MGSRHLEEGKIKETKKGKKEEMVHRYMEFRKVQQKRTTSREDINKSQGPRSNNGHYRAMRKSFWLLQCFLPRSGLGGGGLWKLRNPVTNSCSGDPNSP